MKMKIYAGTYTVKDSKGIYRFEFEDGNLSDPELFCAVRSSKYLCSYGDKIITICDGEEKSGLSLIDEKGTVLDTLLFEKPSSCYVTVHDDLIYTANYHAGTLSRLRIREDKFELLKSVSIRDKAGCHQVLFHEDKILVPALFLDKVLIFNEDLDRIGEIAFPEGSGPRHGIFNKDHTRLYLVSELSNELFLIDPETMEIIDSIGLLENGEKHVEGTAAVRLDQKESFLYVSTRGKNVLSVIDVREKPKLIQNADCGGDHPRDFILTDNCLLCADRFSDEVVCFRIEEDGLIGEECGRIRVPEAICLITA
ncbi:MAG: beta-propeller fold lactonase family protein [Erysipelotrichaceae bacterium]|nr:beta-propeller fold lactonase family protein [Erysipelotrichaceae bacterium]